MPQNAASLFPDAQTVMAALLRAAANARRIALQTDTELIVVSDAEPDDEPDANHPAS